MLETFCQYLPCFASLAMLTFYLASKDKLENPFFKWVAGTAALYYFCDAAFITVTDNYNDLIYVNILSQVVGPCAVPAIIQFLYYETKHVKPKKVTCLGYLPGTILGIATMATVITAGIERISEFSREMDVYKDALPPDTHGDLLAYWICSIIVSKIILVIWAITGIIITIVLLYEGYRNTGFRLRRPKLLSWTFIGLFFISVFRMGTGRGFLLEHPLISSVSSTCSAMLIVVLGEVYFSERQKKPSTDASVAGSAPATEKPQSPDTVIEGLQKKVIDYLRREKPYLDPTLTMNGMAEKLATNRTYLSQVFNRAYGKPFRETINMLRIRYAEDYIRQHRDAKLEEVAEASGFTSGAQMSRKFKDVEGKTPMAWIREQL